MQTIAYLNGILIKDILTESIDHTPLKDETNVDQVGVAVTVVFSGVVHTSAIDHMGHKVAEVDINGIARDFAPGLSRLLQKLTKDRRRFTMKIGGQVLYDVIPGASDLPNSANSLQSGTLVDIAHGPIPSVQVIKIISGLSASIRVSVKFVIPNCDGQGKLAPSGLVNFRWWVFEDVDAGGSWLTTRTYTGRLRVAHKFISPHALARVVTVPPLQRGFKRKVVSWHESPDGLHLDFVYQDVEQIASAPWNRFAGVGATDWSGTLKMSSNTFGITGVAELDFHLSGPRGTSKLDLMDIAFRICQAKAKMFDFSPGGKSFKQGFMEYFSMGESLHGNEISVQCRIMHTGSVVTGAGAGLLTLGNDRVLGQPMGNLGINYDPEISFHPGPSAGVGGIFLSLLSTPCNPGSMPQIPASQIIKKGKEADLPATPDYSQSTGFLSESQSEASASQLEAMYLEYSLASEIFVNGGRIAMANGAAKDSKDPSLTMVNLHRPTAIREIRIDASRINSNPEIPTPNQPFKDANGIDHTPIDEAKISAVAPQVSADNRKLLFRTQVQMQYALSRPPGPNDRTAVGCVPYRVVSLADPSRSIMPAAFINPANILR